MSDVEIGIPDKISIELDTVVDHVLLHVRAERRVCNVYRFDLLSADVLERLGEDSRGGNHGELRRNRNRQEQSDGCGKKECSVHE